MTDKQIVKIEDITEDNAAQVYVAGGLKPFFEKVQAEVSTEVPDLKTAKGRERIASLASKVSKSKTAVEKPGRDYLRRLKEMPKVVEAELRTFVQDMDDLRDATRKPLTDWEDAEKARKQKLETGIEWFNLRANENTDLDSTELAATIAQVEAVIIGEKWQEYEDEARSVKAKALASLNEALVKRKKFEADQAELEKLRQDKAIQDQKDRDEQIRREAAEQATKDAEAKAQAERDAAAKREQDLKDQADNAEAERLRLAKEAEDERVASAKRQADAVEQARLDEIQRQANEKAEQDRQAAAREADVAHKTKVLGDAKQAILLAGVTEDQAREIVNRIRAGLVPNVSITF